MKNNSQSFTIKVSPKCIDITRGETVFLCITLDEWRAFADAVRAADLETWPKTIEQAAKG